MWTKSAWFLVYAAIFAVTVGGALAGNIVEARGRQNASGSGKTVLDGVYTVAQAERGKEVYSASCSKCHRDDLSGNVAWALKGDRFMQSWGEDNLNSLYSKISKMMPASAPGSLSAANYLDLIAHILQVNNYPAGSEELKADAEVLENIRVVGPGGPGPVPNFALVRVVGCLTQGEGNAWMLTNTSELVRTRNSAVSSDAELKQAGATPLGTLTFRLMQVFPRPDAHKGHKMEAKGILARVPDGDRINVVSLGMVDSNCTP